MNIMNVTEHLFNPLVFWENEEKKGERHRGKNQQQQQPTFPLAISPPVPRLSVPWCLSQCGLGARVTHFQRGALAAGTSATSYTDKTKLRSSNLSPAHKNTPWAHTLTLRCTLRSMHNPFCGHLAGISSVHLSSTNGDVPKGRFLLKPARRD